jgi:hypothetical protein
MRLILLLFVLVVPSSAFFGFILFSVYDKLNIFRDRLSDTVEDLGETSVEIIHGVVGVTGQAYEHVVKPGLKK